MTKRQKVYWENHERSSKPEIEVASPAEKDEVNEEEVSMEEDDHDKTSK